jgi:hypothetical protein
MSYHSFEHLFFSAKATPQPNPLAPEGQNGTISELLAGWAWAGPWQQAQRRHH